MRTVAEGHRFGVFTGTPGHSLRLFDHNFLRLKSGPGMRAIAKRLAFRSSAGAPPINARLDLLHDGRFLENDGFGHNA